MEVNIKDLEPQSKFMFGLGDLADPNTGKALSAVISAPKDPDTKPRNQRFLPL